MSNLQLRRLWFQLHKWIGLLLAVLIIPLSLSGAALVWHDALDRIINPQHYATSGTTLLPLDRYAAAAHAVLKPGERIAALTLPEHGGPIIIAAAAVNAPTRPGPPVRTMIYLDPPSARVLDVASSAAGVMRTIHVLHGSLLVPGVGRAIVGWLGVAMLVSSFTGVWLWWPKVGRWTRGLRWRRHRNVDTNLHHLLGFWIALPLFVLSLTGAWIAFPAVFGALVGESGQRPPMPRGPPLAAPAQPLATVAIRALATVAGQVHSISWPTETSPDWTVTVARGDGPPRSVKVSDDSGTATAARAREPAGVGRLMRRIHDGEGMGMLWQTIIFIAGVVPAVLAVTGVIMWWRARRWRGELARRRRGAVA